MNAPLSFKQPWLHSKTVDSFFILGPSWIVTAALLTFPELMAANANVSPMVWLLLVVCIDVAHVYSTLYRTYFDTKEVRTRPLLYIGAPIAGFAIAVMIYSLSAAAFWTALAYLAVFHFVRQQYGFLMLYSRNDRAAKTWMRYLDRLVIYLATIYPLIYWHTHLPRAFNWFVDGDFLALPLIVDGIARPIYLLSLVAYCFKELRLRNRGQLNAPRNLLVFGTAASWYVGIVIAQGDLGFTLANVVAHGVPYMALIWIYGSNQGALEKQRKLWFGAAALPLFVAIPVAIGYFEEGIWDGLVWRDHSTLFQWASGLPALTDHATLSIVIPFLALPQLTHYILDGFIWRLKHNPDWRRIVLYKASAS